jgi:transcriptional regulator GlxA family with amidase domain
MAYRIAVIFEANQLSDIVGIDLFGNCSREYMDSVINDSPDFSIPPHLAAQAVDMEILYVSSTLEPARMTASIKVVPTHTYETCPRDVDVVLVGGPLLHHRPAASIQFFKDVFGGKGKKGVVFMTTCVGSLWLADSGVLKGKKVTTNRMMLDAAKKMHPDVEWTDKRWVVDQMDEGKGEIWTSGGAGCGKYSSEERAVLSLGLTRG